MHPPVNPRAPRRLRVALLLGMAALLSYSGASAQSDKNWLESALEKTLRLSSPWELPVKPQLEGSNLPDGAALEPDTPAEPSLVLEVPWGSERVQDGESGAEPGAKRLEVHLVDDFEDPWHNKPSSEVTEGLLVEPWPESEHEARPQLNHVGTSSSLPYGKDLLLIDPWED